MEDKQTPFAVVTGASSGIGREIAKVLAEKGFDLLITARDLKRLEETATKLRKKGANVSIVPADLAAYDGVETLYGAIEAAGRPLDAIAINAGRGVGGRFAGGTRLQDELELIQLNISSYVHLAKRVLPRMVARRSGRILFTGSVAGTTPLAFESVYSASKAFVNSFSRALRAELKGSGVTVTLLMPSATETRFFHRAGMDDTAVGKSRKDDPAEVARQGVEAMLAGKASIFGGSIATKMQGNFAHLLPEDAKATLFRHHSEPGSGRR